MRSITAAFVATTVLLVGAIPAGAAATGSESVGFGVAPLRFDVETKAGSSSMHPITITNTDSTPTTFTFSKEDFQGDKQDPAATPVLMGGKFASDISGYDWLSVPEPVTIPPNQSRTIGVRVSVPAGATGAHYAALIVASEGRTAGEIVAQSRLAVLFLMNSRGAPPPDIVITEIQQVGPTKVVTEFINKGKGPTRNTEGVLTEDPKGPGKKRTYVGVCTKDVLPNAAGQCIFEIGKDGVRRPVGSGSGSGDGDSAGGLAFGPVERHVDIVGDPGTEGTSARGALPTEWAGSWSSMLLPLVGVALFVLYFLFLRRRRKDREPGDPAFDGSSFT